MGMPAEELKSNIEEETLFDAPCVPNAETLEAIEEVRRMKADPSLGKTYTDIKQMFDELLSDV